MDMDVSMKMFLSFDLIFITFFPQDYVLYILAPFKLLVALVSRRKIHPFLGSKFPAHSSQKCVTFS